MNNEKGQAIVIVIVILIVFTILISLNTIFVINESNWTIKEKRSISAFNLAEAGVDRAYWKLTERSIYWENLKNGTPIPGYNFDTVYSDIPSTVNPLGYYTICIASSPPSTSEGEDVKITCIAKDKGDKEIRAIEVIYTKTKGIQSATVVGGKQEWKEGFWVHWGPAVSYNIIDLQDDQDDIYWPRRFSVTSIKPWDENPAPPNEYPFTNPADQKCGYAYYELPTPPEIDFDYYKDKAKKSWVPMPEGSAKNADPTGSGYFPNAGEIKFQGYDFRSSTSVIYIEQAKVMLNDEEDEENDNTFIRVEALLAIKGNMHIHSDGIDNYTVSVPTTAWKEYQAGKPRNATTDSADHQNPDTILADEYPGDGGYRTTKPSYTMPGMFDAKKYTKNTIKADGVAFHGFLYSGPEREHCSGGRNIIVGVVYARAGLDVDTVIIYYDSTVGENIKTSSGGLKRSSWREVLLTWPAGL